MNYSTTILKNNLFINIHRIIYNVNNRQEFIRMRKVLGLLLGFFIIFESASARTTAYYEKRFSIVRESGKIVSVIDNSISNKFSLKRYVSYLKDKIKKEQDLIEGSFSYDISVRALFADDVSFYNQSSQNIDDLISSLRKLPVLDTSKIFSNPAFREVIQKFELRLSNVLAQIDPRIIARPQDPNFFYNKKKTYRVLLWGLNYAKKKLSTVPLLNTASYIMVEVEKMVRTRREFHQNMFLYYLDSFKEEELGLTWEEANRIYSSIYESRIPWYAFWESAKAELTWNTYGTNSFYKGVRVANSKLRHFRNSYVSIGVRNSFAFQEVNLNGEDVMINLFDYEGIFHRTPAISFSRMDPYKIGRKRLLFQLGGLGVSFLPLYNFIKDNINTGFKSYYEQQMITEGSLYGYFESMEQIDDQEQLQAQYLNPFESL